MAPSEAIQRFVGPDRQAFLEGACWALFEHLHRVYPHAQAWYEPVDGHVYTCIDGLLYDAAGVRRADEIIAYPLTRDDRRTISQVRRCAVKSMRELAAWRTRY